MSSSPAGLPYAMQRTPVTGSRDTCNLPFVHRLDQELKIFERGRREHPVPEVEDVTRPAGGAAEHIASPLSHQLRRPEQHRWIEVALNSALVSEPVPRHIQRHAPIDGHRVRTRRRYRLEESSGVGAEVDAWNIA